MIQKSIIFRFKGERKYIHGPDMLNQSLKIITEEFGPQFKSLRFTFHRMTDKNLVFVVNTVESMPDIAKGVATFSFELCGKRWHGYLSEIDSKPELRVPYDEDGIGNCCNIDKGNKNITFNGSSPYSFVEVVVAMNKALLSTIFPDAPGKWVFCGWEGNGNLDIKPEQIKVKLVQNLATRLVSSEVFISGKSIGKIFFSSKVK